MNKPKNHERSEGIESSSPASALCIIYLCAWSIIPQLQLGMFYRVLAIGCAIGWYCIFTSQNAGNIRLPKDNLLKAACIFLILVVTVTVIQHLSISKVLTQISIFMLFLGYVMVNFYYERSEELSFLTIVIILLFLLPNYTTFNALLIDPHIMRLLVRSSDLSLEALRHGIGGYSLLYSQVCIFPAILSWTVFAWQKHKIKFGIGCLWLLSYLLLVLKAGYTIAIVTTLIGIYVLYFYKGKSVIGIVVIVVSIFTVLSILVVYSLTVREFLLEFFEGTTVTKKINDLVLSAEAGEAEGSVNDRTVRYLQSIKSLCSYPIIGGLWQGGGGGHSAIIDMFAQYGIFGGYIFYKMFLCAPQIIVKGDSEKHTSRVANASSASILTIGILNSATYQFMFPITIVLFAILSEIRKWESHGQCASSGQSM